MSIVSKNFNNQSSVAKTAQGGNKDSSLNIKEVGYLLQMIEVTKHSGQALELALVCKMKLQALLDELT